MQVLAGKSADFCYVSTFLGFLRKSSSKLPGNWHHPFCSKRGSVPFHGGGGGFGWHRRSARLKEHVSSGTQPRPGVEPGDPQHEAEGWTQCPQGRGDYACDAELPRECDHVDHDGAQEELGREQSHLLALVEPFSTMQARSSDCVGDGAVALAAQLQRGLRLAIHDRQPVRGLWLEQRLRRRVPRRPLGHFLERRRWRRGTQSRAAMLRESCGEGQRGKDRRQLRDARIPAQCAVRALALRKSAVRSTRALTAHCAGRGGALRPSRVRTAQK